MVERWAWPSTHCTWVRGVRDPQPCGMKRVTKIVKRDQFGTGNSLVRLSIALAAW